MSSKTRKFFTVAIYFLGLLLCMEVVYVAYTFTVYSELTENNLQNDYKTMDFDGSKEFPKEYDDIIKSLRYYKETKWYYNTITDEEISGQYYTVRDEIHINGNHFPKHNTIVHEYVHSLRNKFPKEYTGDLTEEQLTDVIAYQLANEIVFKGASGMKESSDSTAEDVIYQPVYRGGYFYMEQEQIRDTLNKNGIEKELADYYTKIEKGELTPKIKGVNPLVKIIVTNSREQNLRKE